MPRTYKNCILVGELPLARIMHYAESFSGLRVVGPLNGVMH